MNATAHQSIGNANHPARTAGFYVSVQTGERLGRTALALGPFPDHSAALAEIERVRRYVAEQHRGGAWWQFGTTRIPARPGRTLPTGTLNPHLGM